MSLVRIWVAGMSHDSYFWALFLVLFFGFLYRHLILLVITGLQQWQRRLIPVSILSPPGPQAYSLIGR